MWLYPTNITYFRRYTPFGRRSYGRTRALAAIPATISETIYLFCNFRKFQYLCTSNRKDHPSTSPDGGIGRRAGLKHQWSNPCRFDPGSGYQTKCKRLIFRHLHFSFCFLHHACTTEWAVLGQNLCFSKNFSRRTLATQQNPDVKDSSPMKAMVLCT